MAPARLASFAGIGRIAGRGLRAHNVFDLNCTEKLRTIKKFHWYEEMEVSHGDGGEG